MDQQVVTKEMCDNTHKHYDQRLTKVEAQVEDHDRRLDKQEQYKASSEVQITNLCQRIDDLVGVVRESNKQSQHIMYGVSGTVIVTLIGFVIWYIQTL